MLTGNARARSVISLLRRGAPAYCEGKMNDGDVYAGSVVPHSTHVFGVNVYVCTSLVCDPYVTRM